MTDDRLRDMREKHFAAIDQQAPEMRALINEYEVTKVADMARRIMPTSFKQLADALAAEYGAPLERRPNARRRPR